MPQRPLASSTVLLAAKALPDRLSALRMYQVCSTLLLRCSQVAIRFRPLLTRQLNRACHAAADMAEITKRTCLLLRAKGRDALAGDLLSERCELLGLIVQRLELLLGLRRPYPDDIGRCLSAREFVANSNTARR